MNKYEVVEDFRDLQDKEKIYLKGEAFPRPANKKTSEARIEELSTTENKLGQAVIKEIEEAKE